MGKRGDLPPLIKLVGGREQLLPPRGGLAERGGTPAFGFKLGSTLGAVAILVALRELALLVALWELWQELSGKLGRFEKIQKF